MALKHYFTPRVIRTKEQSEEMKNRAYFFIYDKSTGKDLSLFSAFIFHQWRALIYFRVSVYDADIRLLFDFISINFNWSLR